MARNLGDMAENELRKWVSRVDITANESIKDREGWDFILQFPFPELEGDIPLDRRDSRIECWVQVKGRETAKKSKSIKLSNWEKLIRSPLPAFFLIFDFGEEDDPRNAYLVHVGEEWINKVFRKLRKLRTNDATKIHKKTLDLTWCVKDRILSLDGKGLSKAIQKHIPDGMEKYAQWKMAIREQVGDPKPAILHISTSFEHEEELWNLWVDFIIGIREEMPAVNVVLEEDVRFDIPSKVSQLGEGIFKYKPNSLLEGSIVFRDDANIQRVVFEGKFLTPYGFFPNNPIPEKYIRERVIFEFGDAIIRPHTGEVNVNFRFRLTEEAQTLRSYANFCQLLNILRESPQDGCKFEILDKENEELASGGVKNIDLSQLDSELGEVVSILEDVLFLARLLGVPLDEKVSTDQILSQLGIFRFLRQICDVNIPINPFTRNIPREKMHDKKVAIPFVRTIHLGEHVYVAVTAVAGSPEFIFNNDTDSVAIQVDNLSRVHFEYFVLQSNSTLSEEKIINDLTGKLDNKEFEILIF